MKNYSFVSLLTIFALLASLFLVTTPAAWAKGTEVLVRGKVVDQDGEGIRGARVIMTQADDPDWREELETKRGGRFKLFLRDGARKFDVRVEKTGYQVTESTIEPLVFASAEERQMGLGGTRGSSYEVEFQLNTVVAALQTISAQDAYNQGVQAARARNFDEAIGHFEKTLEMEPGHSSARLALARVYRDVRKPVEAAELLAEILKQDSVDVPTLELSYHVMRDAGRLDEGAAALDRLWQKAPQAAAEELFELATIWRSKGKKEEARSAVERVLEVRPTQADAHYFYARLLHAMEERESAIRHFQRFLELAPNSALVEGVQKKMKQIERELAQSQATNQSEPQAESQGGPP